MTGPQLVAADHPARWSSGVLPVIAQLAAAEADRLGRPVAVLDPFAGVGLPRLSEALASEGAPVAELVGVELQPEWATEGVVVGDATDLPAEWGRRFDVVATSPAYGNRMADHHDAQDPCKACNGVGHESPATGAQQADYGRACGTCKGTGLSWRNTYAHALRRQGGELVSGSAAGLQWGYRYREVHTDAISEMMRCTVEGGLLLVNMSNHVRDGAEQPVVEWWLNQFLHRSCTVVEVRRVRTRRQRHGANGEARVDGEVVIAMRTPTEARLL